MNTTCEICDTDSATKIGILIMLVSTRQREGWFCADCAEAHADDLASGEPMFANAIRESVARVRREEAARLVRQAVDLLRLVPNREAEISLLQIVVEQGLPGDTRPPIGDDGIPF